MNPGLCLQCIAVVEHPHSVQSLFCVTDR